MRKEFASFLHSEMAVNEKIYLLTGDLGYGLWDKIKIDFPDRFKNVIKSYYKGAHGVILVYDINE